jgi:hypothetical protein
MQQKQALIFPSLNAFAPLTRIHLFQPGVGHGVHTVPSAILFHQDTVRRKVIDSCVVRILNSEAAPYFHFCRPVADCNRAQSTCQSCPFLICKITRCAHVHPSLLGLSTRVDLTKSLIMASF